MQAMLFWARQAWLKRSGQQIAPQSAAELNLIAQKAAYGYVAKAIGPSQPEIDTNEAGATRFIYANRDIPAGEKITQEDLHFSRAIHHANPNWKTHTPLSTAIVGQVLGNRVITPVEKGDPVFAENLARPADLQKAYEPGLFRLETRSVVA
jgi:Flp pilus assembly protein CpaB